ncbi:helix-turn-helix domain-containing protein [Paenibacillus sp. EZ-K15]|uniref:helix-turn-helix domain-containing protein n=1 Tax=Paenibacillus sp. EZ-K15 TaxID=2044275 RepID=UPI00137A68DE|nr:helix-turn-helix domain-containing protein [Paenibacillus sp. EZ-K15]
MMKLRSRKYYFRLLMFSLLIGTLPVIIVGTVSYYKSSSIVQEKVNQSRMETLQQMQLRMEQVLKTIDHSVTQYISLPIVVNAMSLPYSGGDYQLYREMYQSMIRSQTFELAVSNMTVLNLNGRWGIDNNNIFTFDDVKEMEKLLRYETLPSFSAWVTNDTTTDSSPSISLVKKIPLNSLKAEGLLIVTIAESELARLLEADNRIGSMVVFNQEYQVLTQSHPSSSKFEELVPLLRKQHEEEGHYNVKLAGDDTSVIMRKSNYNGWTYISAISIKDITRDSRSIGWMTLAVCGLLVLLTAAFSLFSSKSFYRPVRQLVRAVAERIGDAPQEDKGDEFALIGSRVQAMLQSESKLSAQVVGQMRELRRFFVIKLIHGEVREAQLRDYLEEYHYPLDWSWHAALAIQIDSLEDSRYEERDRDLLLFAIANIAGELIPDKERLDPVLLEQSQITIVGGLDGSQAQQKVQLFGWAEGIQQAVREYLGLQVSIGISRPQKRLIEAADSSEQAIEALHYRIRNGMESILFIDDVTYGDPVASVFPQRVAKELYNSVKLLEREQADALLEQCVGAIFQERADWRQYQLSLVRLYAMLTELGQSDSETSAAPVPLDQEKQLFETLLALKTQEEIKLWLRETVTHPIMLQLEQQRKSHARHVSDQVLEMIHLRFDTELTLEACAAQLNYHPNHLGPLFSREQGISFSEYLQHYRLEKAKRWLIETDMKIGEIAEKLTYTNPQNFIRFFRKMENMTPGQYRQLHQPHN